MNSFENGENFEREGSRSNPMDDKIVSKGKNALDSLHENVMECIHGLCGHLTLRSLQLSSIGRESEWSAGEGRGIATSSKSACAPSADSASLRYRARCDLPYSLQRAKGIQGQE